MTDSNSFEFIRRFLADTNDQGIINVEIAVPIKYLSNFWRTIEMLLINCKINLTLTWSANCVIVIVNWVTAFAITDTNLHVPVETLSTHDNVKLLDQLKSGFKRTIKWNKYQSKVTIQQQSSYLDHLTNPSFQGVNRIFVLSFPNSMVRTEYKECFMPTAEIKDYDGKKE